MPFREPHVSPAFYHRVVVGRKNGGSNEASSEHVALLAEVPTLERIAMPIPLIALGIGAVVVAVAAAIGGAAALGAFDDIKRSQYVLIGPKKSGKSTWRTFLAEGVISAAYDPTSATEKANADIPLKDVKLRVTIHDLSGNPDVINMDWVEEARECDHLFYFADLTRLGDPTYKELIDKQARIMSKWSGVKAELTLVLTHADLDPQWSRKTADAIRERAEVVHARRALGAAHVVVGELRTLEGCERLTVDALIPLTGKK